MMNAIMRPILLLITVLVMETSMCDGAKRQRKLQNMEKSTSSPTPTPVTPSPTNNPTVAPTEFPTLYPTAYPTEKKSMERSPQVFVAPTSFPVVAVAPSATTTSTPIAPTTATTPTVTTTTAPIVSTSAPTIATVVTVEPTTSPTVAPTLASESPTVAPSVSPSVSPSVEPSALPIASTNVPTKFPTLEPTYSNLTSNLALRDFSILLISFQDPVINVGEIETAMEQYLYQNMMLENMIDLALTPIAASSEPGSNFTSTSIRFAGTSFFIIEVPTQATLNATQDGVILSSSATADINDIINKNPNLVGVRAVNVSYGQLDPKSLVGDVRPVDDEEDNTSDTSTGIEESSKNNTGLIIGLVFMFAIFLVIGAVYIVDRRRRMANRRNTTKSEIDTTKPASFKKAGDSFYPSLRRQYPDIEKPKEESVTTPNEEEEDDDESESAADLSSYMMTPTGSQVTEVRATSSSRNKEVIQARTVPQEHPTVEISVSHIAEVADDEDYTSTDDASGKFRTDMSECTFK